MTIGHLVECLMSKVAACVGKEGDATPFTEVTVENISSALHRYVGGHPTPCMQLKANTTPLCTK